LQKEIEKHFPGVMDITDVFVYPTIEQMAEFIDSKRLPDPADNMNEEAPPVQDAISVPEQEDPVYEDKLSDEDQMRRLLELLASGEIDVSQAGQLL
jgi:hypothetical protein